MDIAAIAYLPGPSSDNIFKESLCATQAPGMLPDNYKDRLFFDVLSCPSGSVCKHKLSNSGCKLFQVKWQFFLNGFRTCLRFVKGQKRIWIKFPAQIRRGFKHLDGHLLLAGALNILCGRLHLWWADTALPKHWSCEPRISQFRLCSCHWVFFASVSLMFLTDKAQPPVPFV